MDSPCEVPELLLEQLTNLDQAFIKFTNAFGVRVLQIDWELLEYCSFENLICVECDGQLELKHIKRTSDQVGFKLQCHVSV